MTRRDYIETWSGKDLYLPEPDLFSIDIHDIAHALSKICRFAGHVDRFYSVAEHSINVSSLVLPEHRLQALLHDATEAYLCDIPTPFKRMVPQYEELETHLWAYIAFKFDVPVLLHGDVKMADRIMLLTERDALKANTKKNWSPEYESTQRWAGFKELGLSHVETAELFLEKFYEYGGKD